MFKNLIGDKEAYASSLKETEVVKKGIWIQNVVVHNSITEE